MRVTAGAIASVGTVRGAAGTDEATGAEDASATGAGAELGSDAGGVVGAQAIAHKGSSSQTFTANAGERLSLR